MILIRWISHSSVQNRHSKSSFISILLWSTSVLYLPTSTSWQLSQRSMTTMTSSPRQWLESKSVAISKCIIPLSPSSHKGSSGRVGILGGSARYTGAPFYASMASLKVGSDLCYVFCAQEATVPIKCYSPELMVTGIYSAAEFDTALGHNDEREQDRLVVKMTLEITTMMHQMHVLVIGPGLGRCPLVMRATVQIIKLAMEKKLFMVVDADALFLLTLPENRGIFRNYDKVVFTPNVVEYKRLLTAYDGDLSKATSGIIIQKGAQDIISCSMNSEITMTCDEEGGLKRSGGLGDILAGTVGTFLAWNEILSEQGCSTDRLLSCWSACCVTKKATKLAFERHRRSMTAPDVINLLGETFEDMTNEGSVVVESIRLGWE